MYREKLTKEDIKRIQAEIDHRKLVVRPAALQALKEARAMGDLSENFEYHCAKRDNNQNNGRIRYLEKMIENAIIIDDTSKEDEVGMNNTVIVQFTDDGSEETFRIVTPIRSDSRRGLISNESPLGKALLGHKVGDTVDVVTENGVSFSVLIKELRNTGESEDDAIHQY